MSEMQTQSVQDILTSFDASLPREEARTFTKEWYTDPRIHDLEQKEIFGKTWQIAARIDELPNDGDRLPLRIGNESVVLTRMNGTLYALSNICRHNAFNVVLDARERMELALADDEGGCKEDPNDLQCMYHGWKYGLDGKLKSAAGLGLVKDFCPQAHSLVQFPIETWGPFIWVNCDTEAAPLTSSIGPMMQETNMEEMARMQFHEHRVYKVQANWKLFCNNYGDGGWHIKTGHPQLAKAVIDKGYHTEVFPGTPCSVQRAPLQASDDETMSDVRSGYARYWQIGNTMINVYEGSGVMDVNVAIPTSPESCDVHFYYYFDTNMQGPEADEFKAKSIVASEVIQEQDRLLCEQVQRNMRSAHYDRSVLGKRETAAHHFQKYVAGRVRGR